MRKNVGLEFAGYCLLAGSTWLFDSYFGSTWPSLLRLGVHDLVLFVLLGVVAMVTGQEGGSMEFGEIAAWSAILFAGPAVLFAGIGGHVGGFSETLVFALVPFVTGFIVAQRGGEGLGPVLPAVIAVGGMALILPFAWPSTVLGFLWLLLVGLIALLVAIAGVRLNGLLEEIPLAKGAAAASGAAAVVALLGWWAFQGSTAVDWSTSRIEAEVLWGLMIDGPLLLLTVWLLKRMDPIGFSTRFLLVPFVTIVGSFVVLRPTVMWTTWLGLALVAGGSWALLSNMVQGEDDEEEEPEPV